MKQLVLVGALLLIAAATLVALRALEEEAPLASAAPSPAAAPEPPAPVALVPPPKVAVPIAHAVHLTVLGEPKPAEVTLKCGELELSTSVDASGVAVPSLIPCEWRVLAPEVVNDVLHVDEKTVELELRVRTPLVEVRINVLDEKGRAVGERVRLTCGRQEVSGQVDVMGSVTLPLWPCEWDVRTPKRVLEPRLRVDADTTVLDLHVASEVSLVVRGEVVDSVNQPVGGARVQVDCGGRDSVSVGTIGNGSFHAVCKGTSAVVRATAPQGLTRPVTVTGPTASVRLRLEETTALTVKAVGRGADVATLIVTKYQVRVERAGFKPQERVVRIASGKPTVVKVELVQN